MEIMVRKRGKVTCALAYSLAAGPLLAQVVPLDFNASPDVYRVRAENDQLRSVEGTWKPGQRDQFHSHPALGYYWVSDCSVRFYLPDGTHRDAAIKAGTSGVQAPMASHSLENVGKSDCRIVMFEVK